MPEDEINFAQETGISHRETLKDLLFEWSVRSGRAIVVITGAIVIILFSIRIKLANDLRKSIEEYQIRKEEVSAKIRIAEEYESFQSKISTISNIMGTTPAWNGVFKRVENLIPSEIIISQISIGSNSLKFNAKSTSVEGFKKIFSNMIASEFVDEIIISQSGYNPKEESFFFAIEVKGDLFNFK